MRRSLPRTFLTRRSALAGLASMIAIPTNARPLQYVLDPNDSVVGFTYQFEGRPIEGRMPVQSADLTLDFSDVSKSNARVVLDVRRARAGFLFATEAMKGAEVLDARDHPSITFQSRITQSTGAGARMVGDLTIRGVTQRVTLDAQFFRPPGSAPGERDRLSILLTGAVDRNDFGATGFQSYVAPKIDLRILARIRKVG